MFAAQVEAIIEGAVCEQKLNLEQTKQLIFKNLQPGELVHAADVKIVESHFINVLLDCARVEFEDIFNTSCKDKNFIDSFTRDTDQFSTLDGIKRLRKPGFYGAQLELHWSLVDEFDRASFTTNLKAYVWRRILEESQENHAELQMLQCLIVCFQTNTLPDTSEKKLQEFERHCASQSRPAAYLKSLMTDVGNRSGSIRQLRDFLSSVKNLKSDHLLLENQLLKLIHFYLKPVDVAIKADGNRFFVEITGGRIRMSEELSRIETEISNSQQPALVRELRFIALHMLNIDCNLENARWHGFNIVVMSANVNVSRRCEWHLSGLSSQQCYEKAQNGTVIVKDGYDGVDGHAGESSGNVMILAEQMQNAANLKVIMNGGSGSGGQDGGDGARGNDGTGITMSDLKRKFPSPIHLAAGLRNAYALFDPISSLGETNKFWKNDHDLYVEVQLENGQEIIHSVSRRRGWRNGYLLYKGSDGQPGGRGGLNGLGGQGGYPGECVAISQQNQTFPIAVVTTKGSDGQIGKPGRTGEFGKNGWDVGYTDYQWWSNAMEFGAMQNERLTMVYSTDSSGRVYCGYRDEALNSRNCYATMKASTLGHRKLTENEKSRETRQQGQRKQHATATRKNTMQRKAMEKTYGDKFENIDSMIDGVSAMHTGSTANFDRMQRGARKAFEEVEGLKERSREKVSRYQIYDDEKKTKKTGKTTATKNSESREKRTSQLLARIASNPVDENIWNELLDEEFTADQLRSVNTLFADYQRQRKIETPEIKRMQQKMGLGEFSGAIEEAGSLPHVDESFLSSEPDAGTFLKVCENSRLKWLEEFQHESVREESIQSCFDQLLQQRLSVGSLAIVRKYYENETLQDLLENAYPGNDNAFETTLKKLSTLKANRIEWAKLLELLNSWKSNVSTSAQLNNLGFAYDQNVLKNDEDLLKYLFHLRNPLRCLKHVNHTLSRIVELFIVTHRETTNDHARIEECVTMCKDFTERKQESMRKIMETVRFLSQRGTKASWRRSHEYPSFCVRQSDEEHGEQDIDEQLLQGLYDLYTIKQNETVDWHKEIDDQLLEMSLKTMKSDKTMRYAPLLELIAWKQQLNLRIYDRTDDGQFFCTGEYFEVGKQVEHLFIGDDQTVKGLVLDRDYAALNLARRNMVTQFHLERQEKTYRLPDPTDDCNEDLVIYHLCQFFNEDDRDDLGDRLEKLSAQFLGVNSLLASLLHCFRCNGCHLSSAEIGMFVNTVLACRTNYDQDPELFSYIVLSRSQYQLIDELILIKLENVLRKSLKDKATLRQLLQKIVNSSVKIVLAEKLNKPESSVNEELVINLLGLLPYIGEETCFLEQLNLSDWSITLKRSYWQHVLSKGGIGFIDENLEQCSFYLMKLEDLYGDVLVKYLVDALKEATLFSTKTLLTFVHRFHAEDVELCDDVLTNFAILNSTLLGLHGTSNMPEKKYSGKELLESCERKQIVARELRFIESLMQKLGLLESTDRQIEDLVEMIKKSPEHNDDLMHLSEIEYLLQTTVKGENPILAIAVKYTNNMHLSKDTNDYHLTSLLYDTCCKDDDSLKRVVHAIRSQVETVKRMPHHHAYMLDIVNRGILLKRGFGLRDTQKLVVLLTLMNEKSLLAQVATGEGKTLIITTLCIIKCLYGEKLDIVTSCSVLAKRDAESLPPKGNTDLYALFGVRVGHICSEDIEQRTQIFNSCDVIYGDLSSFQRDYLLDRFYGKNILGTHDFGNVIVDEVDSMLLDNGNNMLYLSHDIPNMDKLQSLLVFIWRSVNRPIESIDDLQQFYDSSAIKESIIADLYGAVMPDEVDEIVWKKLLESKTIGKDGRLLRDSKDCVRLIRSFNFANEKTENRLTFLLNSIAARQRYVKIPPELYPFVERHLDKFIDNAKNALFMNEGVDYVLDVDRTGLDPDLNPKIIIIDKDTGTDQSSSQWHEGLHQFLQLKHGCKLSLMSLKAVFVSNVSYLKLYRNLYGLSGTLGSKQEKHLLNELYGVGLVKIPTSKPKRFYEERPIIAGDKEQWIECIYAETKRKIRKQRSVLIIGETVKDVDYITKQLIKRASEDQRDNPKDSSYESLQKPYVYKREHEEFTFGQGNEFFGCGKVIVATNLAGRGTDIKLEKQLVEAGGLYVILTFLPNNGRVEEQAYGRAARCGEDGSGQLIIIGNEEDGGTYSSKIFQLKNARDVNELQRLGTVKKYYDERISIEEKCFAQFKKRYEERRDYLPTFVGATGFGKLLLDSALDCLPTSDGAKEIKRLLLDSFLDKWAFWLDENSHLIESQASEPPKKELLFHGLTEFLGSVSFKSETWLDSPSQLLKLGIHYAKTKNYATAETYFQRIITGHPYYMAEALYYKSFATIKQATSALLDTNGSQSKALKKDLIKAKELFEERINDCTNDQAIVESFKRKETNSLIHIEAFTEQQKTIAQIYNHFINSIDDILGHPMSHNALVNFELSEILAYDVFIELQKQGIVTRPRTAEIFSDDALGDVAIEYGILPSAQKGLRKHLTEQPFVSSESIATVVSLPNVEEFWSILKELKVLHQETEFIVVNKPKLAQIDSTHLFPRSIDQHKMNVDVDKLESTELILYPVQANEEQIFCSVKLYDVLNVSDITYLEERAVCSKNRRAKLNAAEIQKKQNFAKFDSVTYSDLTNAKISADDAIAILEILSQKDVGVLEERADGKYKLKSHIDCSLLPKCYQDVVAAILNSTFAYRLAYGHLQEQFEEIQKNSKSTAKLRIRVTSNPHQKLLFDLIGKGVVNDARVIYQKLKSVDMKQMLENFHRSSAKNREHLKKKENIEFVKKNLDQLCCGVEKLETPDCFFSALEGALKMQQNSSIVEASWFSLNGMEDLITLQEQAYSWKYWRNVLIVTGLALAQITIGALIEIWTAGVGTYAASFLINEGT